MKYTKIKKFCALFLVVLLLLLILATLVVALLGNKVNPSILNGLIATMIFVPVFMYILSIFFKYFDNRNKKRFEASLLNEQADNTNTDSNIKSNISTSDNNTKQ